MIKCWTATSKNISRGRSSWPGNRVSYLKADHSFSLQHYILLISLISYGFRNLRHSFVHLLAASIMVHSLYSIIYNIHHQSRDIVIGNTTCRFQRPKCAKLPIRPPLHPSA